MTYLSGAPTVSEQQAISLAAQTHRERYAHDASLKAATSYNRIYDTWFVEIVGVHSATGYHVWHDEGKSKIDLISDGSVHLDDHKDIVL